MKRVITVAVPASSALGKALGRRSDFAARVLVDIDIDGIARRLGIRAGVSPDGQVTAIGGLVKVTYLGSNGS